ncbi:hypothetical protein KKC59_04085 [bacterium]|nr:hypothetical protein [bacterium]
MFSSILDILFPQECILCKKPVKTKEQYFPVCASCDKSISYVYKVQNKNGVTIHSIGIYRNQIQELIHAFKYEKTKTLGKYFAKKIFEYCGKELQASGIDLIIPIPIHRTKLYERGYNQTEVLGRHLSKMLNIRFAKNILFKVIDTVSQTSISKEQRLINLHESFKVKRVKKIADKKQILLIDDVYTTGTTINECIRTFREKERISKNCKLSVLIVCTA